MTAFLIALAVSGVLTGALLPLLRRWRLHDVPNQRSSHAVVTPRGGGIAVVLAVATAVLLHAVGAGGQGEARLLTLLLAPPVLLAVVGLADDVRSLGSAPRLVAQAAVAGGAACSAVLLLGDAGVGVVAFAAGAALGIVAYVNAFNFMDGVNGISALTAAVCGAWFAWLGSEQGLDVLVTAGAALAGASLGFLPWNARAKVFLGDVGSYGAGALIAVCVVVGWAAGVPLALLVAPLLVYLVDTGWVLVKRARAGVSLVEAHRDHAYQRLVLLGWPHLAAAAWTAAVAALCCVVAAVLVDASLVAAFVCACAAALLHLTAPRLAERTTRVRGNAA